MVRWMLVIGLLIFLLFGNYSFANINDAVKHYGSELSSQHPTIGTFAFLGIFLIVLFTDEFVKAIKKRKIKIKENFK